MMWMAAHEMVNVPNQPPAFILAIFGGPDKVEAIHFDPRNGSPVVTMEVRIVSDPPLSSPFIRSYTAEIKEWQSAVELKEVGHPGSFTSFPRGPSPCASNGMEVRSFARENR